MRSKKFKKILKGIYKDQKNCTNLENIDLLIAGKITVFKTLAISKIVHFALVKIIRNSIKQELHKIKKKITTTTSQFTWFNKHIKTDNKSLCNNSLAYQVINHVGQLFNENGMTKAWLNIKT